MLKRLLRSNEIQNIKKYNRIFIRLEKSYFHRKINIFENQKTVRNLFIFFILIAYFDASFKGKHWNLDRQGYFG